MPRSLSKSLSKTELCLPSRQFNPASRGESLHRRDRRGREILSLATARTRRLVLSSRHGRAGGPLVAFRGGAAGKAHFRSEHRFTAMHVNAREAGVLV